MSGRHNIANSFITISVFQYAVESLTGADYFHQNNANKQHYTWRRYPVATTA